MVAVKGIYHGGDTVKLDAMPISVNEPYEVVVAFLNPLQQNENLNKTVNEKNTRRQEAFRHFMQFKGSLPDDFDYKKELEEYRAGRYGHIN